MLLISLTCPNHTTTILCRTPKIMESLIKRIFIFVRQSLFLFVSKFSSMHLLTSVSLKKKDAGGAERGGRLNRLFC